jgi:hypothetical protein
MFIGHFGAAFGAKRVASRPSLGVLFAAAQLPDLLWPLFLLAGWERVRIAPGDTATTSPGTRPRDGIGRYALWGLVLFLLIIYAGDRFGPPPTDANAVAWGTLAVWLPPLWAAWIDRHRDTVTGPAARGQPADAGWRRA